MILCRGGGDKDYMGGLKCVRDDKGIKKGS